MNTNNRPPTSLGNPVTAGSVLLPALNVEARRTLERHGCTVSRDEEAYVITYPLDTVKRMMLPTMPVTRNYRVFLPDGYELIESHDHRRAISQVFYTPDGEKGAALGGRCGCRGYARGIL